MSSSIRSDWEAMFRQLKKAEMLLRPPPTLIVGKHIAAELRRAGANPNLPLLNVVEWHESEHVPEDVAYEVRMPPRSFSINPAVFLPIEPAATLITEAIIREAQGRLLRDYQDHLFRSVGIPAHLLFAENEDTPRQQVRDAICRLFSERGPAIIRRVENACRAALEACS